MLTQLIVWLSTVVTPCAEVVLWPIAVMPGWASATLVAAVTSVLMLAVFKVTSNQAAIRRVRNDIKANMLALSLFKDSVGVGLRAQGRILLAAGRLLALSIVPMLIMLPPTCLLLGQLGLWYQARPLRVGEEAVVTVYLAGDAAEALPEVELAGSGDWAPTGSPVRVPPRRMICWNVQAKAPGRHRLSFWIGDAEFDKELAVGDGFMPTSQRRPEWSWTAALLHPRETPFAANSPVQSIEVAYPGRSSWTSGTDSWLVYWFVVSLLAAFAAKPLLRVDL
ncbi:MAG: hypothetical protein RBS80_19510 [Thermoguttaceae bacterium]|jgi:hypothetical protein|nr:hypothetical protein [Thermoguttaceae bacterium]